MAVAGEMSDDVRGDGGRRGRDHANPAVEDTVHFLDATPPSRAISSKMRGTGHVPRRTAKACDTAIEHTYEVARNTAAGDVSEPVHLERSRQLHPAHGRR